MKFRTSMDRRTKIRFPLNRELRYKLLENDKIVAAGQGETIDMSSGGVAFRTDKPLSAGSLIELSISWPALLYDSCPMRLVVFGRVDRRSDSVAVCAVEKWDFRTGSRQATTAIPLATDSRLTHWLEYRKEVLMKASNAMAITRARLAESATSCMPAVAAADSQAHSWTRDIHVALSASAAGCAV